MKRVYLACPYSSSVKEVRQYRFLMANKCAAYLMKQGYNVFSPISHSHPISLGMDNSNDSKFWVDMDLEWLEFCHQMVVVKLDGWIESKGIASEIEHAEFIGKPVLFMNPETMAVV